MSPATFPRLFSMNSTLLSAATLLLFATIGAAAFLNLAQQHTDRVASSRNGKRNPLARPHKKRVSFDPASQYVSTTGQYAFIPPDFTAGDVRGPCPGLNAAANHGYIPRNGVGTITDFTNGMSAAYGMGLDLSTFLSAYGAVFDGNLQGYSIGGPTPLNQFPLDNLLGLVGEPKGLSGSHNKYEADTSATRGDIYFSKSDLAVFSGMLLMPWTAAITTSFSCLYSNNIMMP